MNYKTVILPLFVVGLSLCAWDMSSVREAVSRPYNERLERLTLDRNLIGMDEEAVVHVLGEPSSRYESEGSGYTLNYAPSRILPMNKFQAHFDENGFLGSIELMD